MTVSIYGRSYNVKRNALRSDFLNLIMDEDTFLLYIAQNKDQVNEFDTLLAINIECQKIIPMFLSVFNEMVEEYFVPVKYNCPAVYIINADASNYVVCDKATIKQRPNATFNNYIAYKLEHDVLYICPNLTNPFQMFGTETKYSSEKPRETKRATLFEKLVSKKETRAEETLSTASARTAPRPEPRNIDTNNTAFNPTSVREHPTERTVMASSSASQPIRRPIFEDIEDAPPTPSKTTGVIEQVKPHMPVMAKEPGMPKKERLYQYCEYDENCIVVHLVCNDAVAIVNKRNGFTNIVGLDDIIKALPEYTKQTALFDFGRCITFVYEVEALKVLDIRTLIRLFEDKKNDPVNKQLITYNNRTLSFALASEAALNEHLSIKDFAILSHREATAKYARLKEHYRAFSKNLYFIATNSTCGIILSSGSGKDNQIIPFEEIYEAFPECQNIGDIMRMFPVEYIIDASNINITAFEQVLGVTIVSEKTLAVCGFTYQIKDVKYGYDTRNKVIMATK